MWGGPNLKKNESAQNWCDLSFWRHKKLINPEQKLSKARVCGVFREERHERGEKVLNGEITHLKRQKRYRRNQTVVLIKKKKKKIIEVSQNQHLKLILQLVTLKFAIKLLKPWMEISRGKGPKKNSRDRNPPVIQGAQDTDGQNLLSLADQFHHSFFDHQSQWLTINSNTRELLKHYPQCAKQSDGNY